MEKLVKMRHSRDLCRPPRAIYLNLNLNTNYTLVSEFHGRFQLISCLAGLSELFPSPTLVSEFHGFQLISWPHLAPLKSPCEYRRLGSPFVIAIAKTIRRRTQWATNTKQQITSVQCRFFTGPEEQSFSPPFSSFCFPSSAFADMVDDVGAGPHGPGADHRRDGGPRRSTSVGGRPS